MALGVLCVEFEEAYIKASNADGSDEFGHDIALDGDTLVVSARSEDSNATGINGNQNDNTASGSAAVYVFVRSGTTWTQQAYLKASNTGSGDSFGWSVDLDGDTLVVGAPFEDSNATGVNGSQGNSSAFNSGAAYVFTRSGTTWTQQAYIKASNTETEDRFGSTVAISGDTIVIASPNEQSSAAGINANQNDNQANQSGAIYIFTRSGNTWIQQAYLKASNPDSDDFFGNSLDIDGDTIIVGAPFESSNANTINGAQNNNMAPEAGAVYVFTRSGTTWTQQAYLKATNAQGDDEFGHSIAISGDTIAVSAHREDSNATGVNGDQSNNSLTIVGAVYVFTRSGTTWTQQAYIKASNPATQDRFGASLSLHNDTLAVGATGEDSNATGINGDQSNNSIARSGAVYIFTRVGTTWTQDAYVKASNTDTNDNFGTKITVSGNTMVVSTPEEDSNARGINGDPSNNGRSRSGAVFVRRISR